MDEPTTNVDGATRAAPPVMNLLAEHVPLSLILDMAVPAGPHSGEILQAEGAPDDAWWEPRD